MIIVVFILLMVDIGATVYLGYTVYNMKLNNQREKYKAMEMKVDSEISYEDSISRINEKEASEEKVCCEGVSNAE